MLCNIFIFVKLQYDYASMSFCSPPAVNLTLIIINYTNSKHTWEIAKKFRIKCLFTNLLIAKYRNINVLAQSEERGGGDILRSKHDNYAKLITVDQVKDIYPYVYILE
jgi:hypothetical protein